MSEMIERVKKAIMMAWDEHGDVPFPLYDKEASALAEAAIKAMQEPTAEMITIGNHEAETCLVDDPCGKAGEHVWKTMARAALQPTTAPQRQERTTP